MEVAAANGRCEQCGELLQAEGNICPSCGAPVEDLPRRPKFTFAILIILLLVGFAITGFVVRGYDVRRQQLADRWFGRGNRDLQSGASLQAISEFETALAYSRDNDTYRLKLALALMQAGKWEEARAHLLNLWEQRPGDGEVNLLLARVFANRNLPSAIRYYQGAIYGVWKTDPVGNRESARFELVEYLLSHGREDAAQAELIALASEAPSNVTDQLRLANLMMKADETDRALNIFQQVRRKQRNNFDAALGAAEANLKLFRFASAAQLAKEALNLQPSSTQAAQLKAQSEALVAADPRARGIGSKERAQRAFAAYQVADARLSSCADAKVSDTHLQQLTTDQQSNYKNLRVAALRDPDLRDEVMRWVYDVEISSAKTCGPPSGPDAILLTLAQAQEKER